MVALKTDEIWARLSAFGLPHPPLDFNSGMDWEDVSHTEAVEMGLIAEDWRAEGELARARDGAGYDFLREVKASARGIRPEFLGLLKEVFGGQIKVEDGLVSWSGKAVNRDRRLANSFEEGAHPRGDGGKFAEKGGDKEAEKGVRAIKRAIQEKTDRVAAMVVPGVGAADFLWVGRGGKGVKKIIEDHGVKAALVAPFVMGAPDSMRREGNYVVLEKGKHKVVLTKSEGKDKRHWMLTAYEPSPNYKKIKPGESRKGFDFS